MKPLTIGYGSSKKRTEVGESTTRSVEVILVRDDNTKLDATSMSCLDRESFG
jgi:hypothetical protein